MNAARSRTTGRFSGVCPPAALFAITAAPAAMRVRLVTLVGLRMARSCTKQKTMLQPSLVTKVGSGAFEKAGRSEKQEGVARILARSPGRRRKFI